MIFLGFGAQLYCSFSDLVVLGDGEEAAEGVSGWPPILELRRGVEGLRDSLCLLSEQISNYSIYVRLWCQVLGIIVVALCPGLGDLLVGDGGKFGKLQPCR
jgi:hypothetical protein